MRINNKYLRNRLFKHKAWRRAKLLAGGEFTYKAFFPYHYGFRPYYYGPEEQLKDHQKSIGTHARMLLNGGKPWYSAPKWFRKPYTRKERRSVTQTLIKMMQGDLEAEIPSFKQDANWDWT